MWESKIFDMGYALRGTPSDTFPTKGSIKNNEPSLFL